MLRNHINAERRIDFEDFLLASVLRKKSSFFRKAQIIKKIKHFHQEDHSKAF